jgi:membrane fusion protein (multidrug efflux system)
MLINIHPHLATHLPSRTTQREFSMSRSIKLVIASMLGAGILVSCGDGNQAGQGAQSQERPPSPVSTISMAASEYPITTILPGRASAFQVAEIRPRVSGIIREVTFKDGSTVKAGDVLYRIEDDTYQAEVARAQALLARAEASVPNAQTNLARFERLVNSGATQIEFENAKLTLKQAEADVAQAKAALETAQINLGLTEIRAPFDGTTSATKLSIGNVVTANQAAPLTTLRNLNPVYIDLIESNANLLRLRNAITGGAVDGKVESSIKVILDDGTEYPHSGKIEMSEMAVSETTGTFQIRAILDNPESLILPGTYVRASLNVGNEKGYLIPQRASSRNANGDLTAKFVSAEGRVETRVFGPADRSGNGWLVTEGVKDGDKLIIDGFQWMAEGMPVAPVEATINEKGLIVPVQQAADGAKAPN